MAVVADTTLYRVVIEGLESVDDSLKSAINSALGRVDILRSGQSFIVAPVEGRANAELVRDMIRRREQRALTEIITIEN